jgi:hypothetical protein
VVSPDERWVATSELHNAWVTAFPWWAQTPSTSRWRARRSPREADRRGRLVGELGGRGKTITWIHGPVFRRLSLEKAFPRPRRRRRRRRKRPRPSRPRAPRRGRRTGRRRTRRPSSPHRRPSRSCSRSPGQAHGTTAYTGARLITMKGDEVIAQGTIVVTGRPHRGGRPHGVHDPARRRQARGPVGEDDHPRPLRRARPPALLDARHLPQRPWKYLANLAYGVTTTHDPSASTLEVFGQSEMVEAGVTPGRASSPPATSSTAPRTRTAPRWRAWTTPASTCGA